MADLPWFKLFASDFLLDGKVDDLPLEAQAILVKMWCLCHIEGSSPAQPEEIARKTRIAVEKVAEHFEKLRAFFEIRCGRLYSHRMEAERQKSEAARESANRRWQDADAKRNAKRNADGIAECNAQSQSQNQDQSQNHDKKNKSGGSFARPTLAEVRTYCSERGNLVDPQQWLDHYTANGWKVGRVPMKDWRAAVRKWEKNGVGAANHRERPTDSQFMGRQENLEPCPLNKCDGSGWWADEATRKVTYCECLAKREEVSA